MVQPAGNSPDQKPKPGRRAPTSGRPRLSRRHRPTLRRVATRPRGAQSEPGPAHIWPWHTRAIVRPRASGRWRTGLGGVAGVVTTFGKRVSAPCDPRTVAAPPESEGRTTHEIRRRGSRSTGMSNRWMRGAEGPGRGRQGRRHRGRKTNRDPLAMTYSPAQLPGEYHRRRRA